ncbi:cyclin-like protein [Hyphopichia burtonii NRRL Y-1933]|uniref:Cyclin-like protein n=1 Tax=Hyphopichia burtonii NRRL Y-1933 TaxID=984485 RepID=A0A1E4REY6_9ASCO|nr:cyclin-like protein [Hyphopichia burtonii NRRL Y-1933]ODV65812.1 cyclin-like protein [Hyphopichia burtonii NRRL Y-1933]
MPDPEVKKENDIETEEPVKTKPRVSTDDLYRRSSQYRMWSYTVESLKETKIQTNEGGRAQALKKYEEARSKAANENPELFEKQQNEFTADKMLELLTEEEEVKYLQYYCNSILVTGNFFNMPTQVKATAMSFFKRFYLVNSAMQYHPKHVLYTVLFLAAKSENYFISIESFCKLIPKVEPKDILDLEFIILQSLKFTLFVHHAFRPLYGFFLDFQAILLHPDPVMYDVNIDTLGSLYDKAKQWLTKYGILSDATFLFTPPQIALAAMYDVDKRITEKYLKRKFLSDKEEQKLEPIKEEEEGGEKKEAKEEDESKKTQREQYELIIRTIRKCVKISKQIPETTKEESANIDKKCFFTLNPNKLIKRKIKQLTKE